jgi:hypothetical protein
MSLLYGARQLQQRESKLEDIFGILSKMYRIPSVNIRPTEIQRATLNFQPARAHAAIYFLCFLQYCEEHVFPHCL